MKYAIVLMDGAADEPLAELDDKTVLEQAYIPHTDWLSTHGQQGLVHTVQHGFSPGSDVALMSVLGYDTRKYYTGRAPLEAAARDIHTGPQDLIFRCNLVTVADGVMQDYSAGHIDTVQASILINDLNNHLGNDLIKFYPGVSYRHLMVFKGESYDDRITPPHDITDQPIAKYLPKGKHSKELCRIMTKAAEILADHEVNKVRCDLGENPATHIWLWGQGKQPQMDSFRQRFGLQGCIITAVDLLRGIGKLTGMKVIEVEGATGYLDTNYVGKGLAAIEAIKEYDLIFVHIEAPDEAGHQALVNEKIKAIEQIDLHIVGPLLKHLQNQDHPWRMMVLPDHPTPIRVRTHTGNPVPFAMAGQDISSNWQEPYSEANAKKAGFCIDKGYELMEFFLRGK
ncbi:MAG: cofactor-independent phosphoglycerate mutase [Sedimentisphaerales bacterium]|nr:cofactor-independent phosphoglycerate mutase [Sedimentisphaerales bacterium]